MLLGAMLVYALHPPLEDAEIALDRVGMDRAAAPLSCGVTDEIMSVEFVVQIAILVGFICVDRRFLGNVLFENRDQRLGFKIVYHNGLGLPVPRSTRVRTLCL